MGAPNLQHSINHTDGEVHHIDLEELYPLAHIGPFRHSIKFFALSIIVFIIGVVLDAVWVVNIQDVNYQETMTYVLIFSVGTCFALFIGHWILEHLRHKVFKYYIKSGNLHIERGLILKESGSFPLSRITDIYTDRSFLDVLFGLQNLHISTPSELSGSFALIPGLKSKDAESLEAHLSALVKE